MSDGEKKPEYACDAIRESIARGLMDYRVEIVEAVIKMLMEGNPKALEVGLALAGEQKELRLALERQLAPKRSLATEWANQPEWTGDDAEGMAWWASKRASTK